MKSKKLEKNKNKKTIFSKKAFVGFAMAMIMMISPFMLAGCTAGEQGPAGQPGSDGKNGAMWLTGTETPEATQGVDGDFYYDTDDYILYQKADNAWVVLVNNFGKPGQNGTDGEDGTIGPIGPIGPEGSAGKDGKDGATWLSGTTTPDAEIGNNGDFYFDKSTYSVYEKVNGEWNYVVTFNAEQKVVKQGWKEDGKLKVLSVGNSFSDDSLEHMYEIAQNAGVNNVEIGKLYIANCSLATHLSNAQNDASAYTYYFKNSAQWVSSANADIETAVKSANWDYIIFQQNSANSGLADTYDDLQALIDIVQPMAPRAKLVWNMTWAYPEGSSHSGFDNYGDDQMTMYNAIVDAVETKILTNDNIDLVMPVGTAIQNMRSSYLDDDVINRDYCHLSHDLGTYTASLAVFKSLTGKSIDNITYVPDNVTTHEKIVAIESVNNAIENKYEVTQSEYDEELDFYQLIDLKVLGKGYYNSQDPEPTHYEGSTPETSTGVWVNKYLMTDKFNRKELPVGTILILTSGYGYRPEGWIDAARNQSRPDEVAAEKVVIDEAWWGDYTERAFNLYANDKPLITDENYDAIANCLKIYVPKF